MSLFPAPQDTQVGVSPVTTRDTVVRSLHDVGLAAWFGGALMGAVGLNGAANDVADPTDRAGVASAGWARWAPVTAAAIGAHLIGGVRLILGNRKRLTVQGGARTNTVVTAALTGVAVAGTAFSGWRGGPVAAAGKVSARGGSITSGRTHRTPPPRNNGYGSPNVSPPRSPRCSSCSAPNKANSSDAPSC